MPSPDEEPLPRTFLLVRSAAGVYAAIGLLMMLLASPRVPYADQYRFLVTFLTAPFPRNACIADNGHREVFPNLVRIAELHWLAANQWLQIGVGTGLALFTALLMIRAFRAAPRTARLAATALVCIGLFWLGNTRKLAHGNESVNLFLVLLSLTVGLRALAGLPRDAGTGRAWVAAAAGFVATLSFGSGPACFAAFLVVLALQRSPFWHWLPVLVGAGLGAAGLAFGGGGASAGIHLAPLDQLEQLLRWLGAPFVWALSPLLDSAHAARLPTALLREPMLAIAGPIEAAFGPPLQARWPATAFGGAGLVWLLLTSVRAWRHTDAGAHTRFALGLAWFGAAVGMLVVLLRPGFFVSRPDQVVASRYVPWSMMFWTGLLLAFVLREGRSARTRAWTALAVAALLLPSQVWTGRYAFKLQRTAELTAIGAAVSVIDREFPLVETRERDLLAALPLLRAGNKAMFAWPEVGWLGRVLDPAPTSLVPRDVELTAVDNRLGPRGSMVLFSVDDPPASRLLLLDADGRVRGLAIRAGTEGRWQGWLQGEPTAAELRVAALP